MGPERGVGKVPAHFGRLSRCRVEDQQFVNIVQYGPGNYRVPFDLYPLIPFQDSSHCQGALDNLVRMIHIRDIKLLFRRLPLAKIFNPFKLTLFPGFPPEIDDFFPYLIVIDVIDPWKQPLDIILFFFHLCPPFSQIL